jgi:hypothetical protein
MFFGALVFFDADFADWGMICYEFSKKRLSPRSPLPTPVLTLISLMDMIGYEFSKKRLSPGTFLLTPVFLGAGFL